MADEPTRIDIAEFRQEGYLQEVNRLFLHPLGLALEVEVAEDGITEQLGGVWDYRDDPEGVAYAEGELLDNRRARRIQEEWDKRKDARVSRLGYMVQPCDDGEAWDAMARRRV